MPKSKDTTSKSLKDTIASIDDHFGKGTVMRMGDRENLDIPSISTGSLGLDIALGIGGIPKGRVTMLAGESMTGKSLFVQKILAKAQEEGLTPVIFDTENAIDPEGAERLGLDITKVKYVPCTSIEQARNSLYKFLMAVREKGLEGKFILL